MRRCGAVGVALALLLAGALRADEKGGANEAAINKEYKLRNGTWEVVRVVVDGKEQPAPKEKATVTLKEDKYTVRQGGKVVREGTGKIDPTTRPKSLDITPATGEYKGKTALAIYGVKGDKQRVCVAPPGKPRPEAFESKEGSGHIWQTYKRVKP
jgi:uncharacterized protein (TIGR03067 family)